METIVVSKLSHVRLEVLNSGNRNFRDNGLIEISDHDEADMNS
jgi:hypothetical protein